MNMSTEIRKRVEEVQNKLRSKIEELERESARHSLVLREKEGELVQVTENANKRIHMLECEKESEITILENHLKIETEKKNKLAA